MNTAGAGDSAGGRGTGERSDPVAATLHRLWGDELPPGAAPWSCISSDVLALDDENGRERGLAVQGDLLPMALLAELLTYVPADAPVRGALPPALARLGVERGPAHPHGS